MIQPTTRFNNPSHPLPTPSPPTTLFRLVELQGFCAAVVVGYEVVIDIIERAMNMSGGGGGGGGGGTSGGNVGVDGSSSGDDGDSRCGGINSNGNSGDDGDSVSIVPSTDISAHATTL